MEAPSPEKSSFQAKIFSLILDAVGKGTARRMRFDDAQESILERIADAMKVPTTTVAGWAVDALGAYYDAHKGNLLMPLDYRKRFRVFFEDTMVLEEPQPPPVQSGRVRAEVVTQTSRGSRRQAVQG